MSWYLESKYTDKGKVFTNIVAEGELEDFDTTSYKECEGYDRYVDKFNTLEEAVQAENEAKGGVIVDLIERVESYKVLFKECKAMEPVSMALAKGYKSATPLQRLEIIRELDTELADVYSVEIPVITAWVRDDNYVHSTKEIFLGEPSLEGFLHQFRHHLQNKAREPQYKYLLVEDDPKADYRIPYKDCMYRMYGEDDARAWARMVIELAS